MSKGERRRGVLCRASIHPLRFLGDGGRLRVLLLLAERCFLLLRVVVPRGRRAEPNHSLAAGSWLS